MSTMRAGIQILRTERQRDDMVRTVTCPVCGVGPGRRCDAGRNKVGQLIALPTSHTGRYLIAADAGLVQPIAGWPWTG